MGSFYFRITTFQQDGLELFLKMCYMFFLKAMEISKTGWGMLMEKACSGSKYSCIMLIH